MTGAEIAAHLARRLPGFRAAGPPEPLSGGSLNHVWRVHGEPATVIVKHAPPWVAAAPDVPLDPSRIAFEARALEALGPGGSLASVATSDARAPRLLDFDADRHVLVMEDVGPAPHLGERLAEGAGVDAAARATGGFVGRLHARSRARRDLAVRFDNRPVQQSRFEMQYRPVGERLRAAGVAEWEEAGRRALALGERFLEPGFRLTMGDLWPPSILVAPAGCRLIDWELCHFGSAAQDLGHLAAHLWMIAHRAPKARVATAARAAWTAFVEGFRSASPASEDEIRDAVAHAGAEILMRTLGPFRAGAPYDGLPADAPPVREAIARGVAFLLHPDVAELGAALRKPS